MSVYNDNKDYTVSYYDITEEYLWIIDRTITSLCGAINM